MSLYLPIYALCIAKTVQISACTASFICLTWNLSPAFHQCSSFSFTVFWLQSNFGHDVSCIKQTERFATCCLFAVFSSVDFRDSEERSVLSGRQRSLDRQPLLRFIFDAIDSMMEGKEKQEGYHLGNNECYSE